MRLSCLFFSVVVCVYSLMVSGCAATQEQTPPPATSQASFSPRWQPLVERLKADGLHGPDIEEQLALFGEPSQSPMGYKITELYRYAFRKPVEPSTAPVTPPKPRARVYAGVPTQQNALLCQQFIEQNKDVFTRMEAQYGVPAHIAVALLFVETRLGQQVGKSLALYSLASMASSTEPAHIVDWLPKLEDSQSRLDWIGEKMQARSNWAYTELTALIQHIRQNKLDPQQMHGSIYGAVGLCQFMPSNLSKLGIDGDGDGLVNLFSLPDALASLSNYLVQNGWKRGMSRAEQHKMLRTYNHIDIYANTILALSDIVQGKEQGQLYATVQRQSVPVASVGTAKKNAKPVAPSSKKSSKSPAKATKKPAK